MGRCLRWVPLAALALAACGGGASPPPPTLESGDVVIETNPLVLHLSTPRGDFTIDDFVEVGVVTNHDENLYYDPRDDTGVDWRAATRATGWDAKDEMLRLDNGARLGLVPGTVDGTATMIVDATGVDDAVHVRVVLPRAAGEPIYGMGENFASADANGSVREMQFRVDVDSESSTNETHVPVPLALWPARGAGALVADDRPGAFDVGVTRDDALLATYNQPDRAPLHVDLFTADDPLDLLRTYAQLSTLPAPPPKWAFAPQQWRNEDKSSQEVRDDAQAMRDNAIPGSVIWIDNPWQTAYNDFTFDETRFDAPQSLIDDLTAQGYKVLVWSTPYVDKDGPTAADFATARDNGWLVTDDRGAPFVFPWQNGPGALVDFTAEGASLWWQDHISRVTDMGIAGFKLDFGEDIVPELVGSIAPLRLAAGDAQVMHDRYTQYYHATYLGALPIGDGFLITRAGYWGEQRTNTCIWPGDLDSDFSLHGVDNGKGQRNVGGLPAAVAGMLSLSASGYPFYGSDIGGFREGPTTTELLCRWSEYAALGTIMQLGGGGASHNPWDTTLFPAPALAVYQTYSRLHMDLVPYLYTLAIQAANDGAPVTRPTRLVYWDAASDDATYLVGEDLFVAPVIEQGATSRDVVLPPGDWIDWWTGTATTGDGTASMQVSAPLETLPLWRRRGALIPMFARAADTLIPATAAGVTSYADPAYGRELRLLTTPAGAASVSLYDGTRASVDVGTDYTVTLQAGDEFDIITLDLDLRGSDLAIAPPATLDGTALATAADEAALTSCAAPGCILVDADRVRARVYLPDANPHELRLAR